MANFKVTIDSISKDLAPADRIRFKDTLTAEKLDTLTKQGTVTIDVDFYGVLNVVNPVVDDEYQQFVVVGKDGTKYVTGSASFRASFENIAEELEAAGIDTFSINVFRLPSKKREGKDFITCSLA